MAGALDTGSLIFSRSVVDTITYSQTCAGEVYNPVCLQEYFTIAITNLMKAHYYRFRIVSVNEAGESEASDASKTIVTDDGKANLL